MDLPPPAREPAVGAESAREGELEWRLSQLEAGLRHIDRRLDRLEESIGQTVARETQAVARDLRRTVSELGRRLVLELPQVLARHRDEIVAELRPPETLPDPGTAAAVALGGPDGPDAGPDRPPDGDARSDLPGGDGPEPPGAPAAAKRRRRVHGLRRRGA